MPKPDWGQKRQCQSCAARFYDMLRDPIVCPSCGATFNPDASTKLRRGQASRPVKETKKPATAAAAADDDDDNDDDVLLEDDVDDDSDEEDDDAIEDASELGEDEDDMSDVIDVSDDDKEDTP